MNFTIDSTVANVIVSVCSGIGVSFLLFLLNQFWKNTISPWYENQIYKDLCIEGKWFCLSFEFRQDIINLERKGHSIEGTMTCLNGSEKGEEYIVTGSFKNLVLTLLYETKDKTKSDRGSITMMAKNNGTRLKGKIAFYDNNRDVISIGNTVWFRGTDDFENNIKVFENYRSHLAEIQKGRINLDKQESEVEEKFEKELRKVILKNANENDVEIG